MPCTMSGFQHLLRCHPWVTEGRWQGQEVSKTADPVASDCGLPFLPTPATAAPTSGVTNSTYTSKRDVRLETHMNEEEKALLLLAEGGCQGVRVSADCAREDIVVKRDPERRYSVLLCLLIVFPL